MLPIGLILLLYREIVRKGIFLSLTRADAYKLLRTLAFLSWSVAMFGILCWVWSKPILHPSQQTTNTDTPPPPVAEPAVIAGTIVDQSTKLGIAQANITVDGQTVTSEEFGNFRIVLPAPPIDRVRLTVARSGYFEADQSVLPPTHDLMLQMRPR